MRIAVIGAGGLGGYFGGRLAKGGVEVAFVGRGAHLAALKKDGLRITSKLGDLHIEKPRVTDDPATLAAIDLVLVGVKLWDTESAARAIALANKVAGQQPTNFAAWAKANFAIPAAA